MLDLLSKLIELLVTLSTYRTERLERVHNELLKPAFEDLLKIHSDYLEMFLSASIALPSPVDATPEAVQKRLEVAEALRQKRVVFEPVRQKIRSLRRELIGTAAEPRALGISPEVDAVVRAMLEYLPDGMPRLGAGSRATVLYTAIRESAATIQLNAAEVHGTSLDEIISETILDCRLRWSLVTEAMARFQLALVQR
jgi:hypothetical protein